MVTYHEKVTDRVKALDSEAEDYLIKPFPIKELMALLQIVQRLTGDFSEHNDNN